MDKKYFCTHCKTEIPANEWAANVDAQWKDIYEDDMSLCIECVQEWLSEIDYGL